jgi:hypothetical protein
MSQSAGGMYSGPTMTPPRFGGAMPQQPSVWPTAVGVILVVIGCAGLLMYGCGSMFTVFFPMLMDKAAQSGGQVNAVTKAQMEVLERYFVWNISNAVVLSLLGVGVLIAGIGILRRRRFGVTLSRVWAIMRIVWVIPATYFGYEIAIENFEAMKRAAEDSGSPMPAGVASMMELFGPIGVAVGVVFTTAMPVFILIWFARGKIRKEVQQWA